MGGALETDSLAVQDNDLVVATGQGLVDLRVDYANELLTLRRKHIKSNTRPKSRLIAIRIEAFLNLIELIELTELTEYRHLVN